MFINDLFKKKLNEGGFDIPEIPRAPEPRPPVDKKVKEQNVAQQYNPKGVPLKPTTPPINVPQGWQAKTQPNGSTQISKQGSMPSAQYQQNMANYKAQNWTPEKVADYSNRMSSGQGYSDAEKYANYQAGVRASGREDPETLAMLIPDENVRSQLQQQPTNENDDGFDDKAPYDSYVQTRTSLTSRDGVDDVSNRTASLSTDRHGRQRVRAIDTNKNFGDELTINTMIPKGVQAKIVPQYTKQQGLDEAHGPYGKIKPGDLEKIQKAKEREKKNAPGQLRRALPPSKQRYRDSSIEYFAKLDEQDVSEGSAQDRLHRRHQELRKKSGLPDPDYYKELKASYDIENDQERLARQAEIKKKYRVAEDDDAAAMTPSGVPWQGPKLNREVITPPEGTEWRFGKNAKEDPLDRQDARHFGTFVSSVPNPIAKAAGILMRYAGQDPKEDWRTKFLKATDSAGSPDYIGRYLNKKPIKEQDVAEATKQRSAYKGSAGAQAIAQASGVKNVNRIVPGQRLNIPGQATPYVVQKGDTLDAIASRFSAPTAAMEPTFTGMAGRPDPTFTGMAGSEFTGISQAPAYNGRGMSGSEFTGISQADTLPSFTGMAGSEKDTKIAARTDTDVDTDGLESGASGFNFVNKEPTNENVPSEEELEQQGREENRFPHFYHHKNNTIFTTPGGDRYDYDDPDQRQRWLDLYKKEFDMPTPHDGGWWRKGPDGDEAMVEQDVAEGISVVKSDYDLDQMVLTFDIEGQRKQFTYWDYDEDFENAERRDVFDQLQRESWYKGLDHPTKMEILDAAYRAIRGLEPAEYRPTVGDEPLDEAGPFSYGAKKPRKGSVADLAAKKRKEQERGKQPIEPRDQMVGTARVVTNEDVESYLDEMRRAGYDIVTERATLCPECGGVAYANQMLAEKQDACYHKVKSRYKVWPSAYASGALVRCRKKGAKNWGNKSKK